VFFNNYVADFVSMWPTLLFSKSATGDACVSACPGGFTFYVADFCFSMSDTITYGLPNAYKDVADFKPKIGMFSCIFFIIFSFYFFFFFFFHV
jgi:hypothetical protein